MIRQLRKSTGCLSKGPEFSSQQSHDRLQASISGYNTLFWHAGRHEDKALIHKNMQISIILKEYMLYIYMYYI